MPEFTRDELSRLYTLLDEFVDALEASKSNALYKPTSSSIEELSEKAGSLQDKIMGILYPPT